MGGSCDCPEYRSACIEHFVRCINLYDSGGHRMRRVGAVRSKVFDKHVHAARYPNQENPQRFTEACDLVCMRNWCCDLYFGYL